MHFEACARRISRLPESQGCICQPQRRGLCTDVLCRHKTLSGPQETTPASAKLPSSRSLKARPRGKGRSCPRVFYPLSSLPGTRCGSGLTCISSRSVPRVGGFVRHSHRDSSPRTYIHRLPLPTHDFFDTAFLLYHNADHRLVLPLSLLSTPVVPSDSLYGSPLGSVPGSNATRDRHTMALASTPPQRNAQNELMNALSAYVLKPPSFLRVDYGRF